MVLDCGREVAPELAAAVLDRLGGLYIDVYIW